MNILFILIILPLALTKLVIKDVVGDSEENNPCRDIDAAFVNITEPGESPACNCFPRAFGVLDESATSPKNDVWIGCTKQNMPSVYRALNALNKTHVSQMWIWNSLINILPNDMFANVRPKTLSIENSGVSVFRKSVFNSIGKELLNLRLKNNILKTIERRTFSELNALISLDLSGNKLIELRRGQFDDLHLLQTLILSNNQIQSVEDGTFDSLGNVQTLNLANNKLTNITKSIFRGLSNLESLNLNGNEIRFIAEDAFSDLKKLKNLNIGANKISKLKLRNLPNIQRLFINGNKLQNLTNLSLKGLPELILLNLDRNELSSIENNHFEMFSTNKKLNSLSLASNKISKIECNAFSYLPNIKVLALQGNKISSLSCLAKEKFALVHSVLRPLQKLQYLLLSENQLEIIEDGDLNVLSSLKELSLDHNKITQIGLNALKGLNLTKLFLNHNNLYYLREGIFDHWPIENIKNVDLSENPWECICKIEWLGLWLSKLGSASTPSGSLRCLVTPCQDREEKGDETQKNETPEPENHSFLITIIAIVLALVAFLFLIAASYAYMQANCYPINPLPLKNLPSDRMHLIPSQESLLSFPNPLVIGSNDVLIKPAANLIPIPAISINIKEIDPKTGLNEEDKEKNSNSDKKRVRFDGV